jgi:2-dehydropantoate 2-reductase
MGAWTEMNILIVGAGSLGLLFAGKLGSVNGEGRHCIGVMSNTSEQSAAIRQAGIVVSDEVGVCAGKVHSFSFQDPERGLHDPQNTPECSQWDWIFLMVKQAHIQPALIDRIRRLMGDKARLLCFQNGIGHVDKLRETIPADRIYVSVTTEGAKKLAANRAAHTGKGVTRIGSADSFSGSALSGAAPSVPAGTSLNRNTAEKSLLQLLLKAGFDCFLSKNMEEAVWNKLLINSVINPLTAILHIRNGQLLTSPFYVKLMRTLYDEGRQVAAREGIVTPHSLWEQLVEVCQATAENSSSMLQDVQSGKPTEIDYINGSIIRVAEKHHISVPTHLAVYQMVKGMEFGSR